MAENDRNKSFGDIFGDEMYKAAENNANRKRSDMWTSGSVDWYKDQLKDVEKARDAEKQIAIEAEKTRKSKYQKADSEFEIKETAKDKKDKEKKDKKSSENYKDSYLASIGGGGLTAMRFDVGEKQLNEAKKQSKILETIAQNTEPSANKAEFLMK